jgi:hypothetical protein
VLIGNNFVCVLTLLLKMIVDLQMAFGMLKIQE